MLTRFLLPLLLLGLSFSTPAASNQQPLHPDIAFKASAVQVDSQTINAQWFIEDEYYLYKEKFRFGTDTPGVSIGEPQLPDGIWKKDPNFGDMEVYRHNVSIKIPVIFTGEVPNSINLKVTSQGCADMGLCYPPQKEILTVAFAAPTGLLPPPSAPRSLGLLSELNSSLGGSSDELLPPDQAFAFSSRLEGSNTLVAEWLIADKYYLYKDKTKIVLNSEGITVGTPEYPPSMEHQDPAFGKVDIWRGPITLKYPLYGDLSKLDSVDFEAKFQGCADLGVCYPPKSKTVSLPTSQLTDPGNVTAPEASPPSSTEKVSEQDAIADRLATGNLALTLLAFFGMGLLLALTPCVFPMIPILSGIIVGEGKNISTRKALMLSISFVLAMALTYTVIGVLAGLFGANIQVWFQNPWVLSIFAAIFVALSFSMFGFYELQMPASIQNKLISMSNNQEGGKLVSAGIMGSLSALIVGPCVTAPLIGALIYIGETGNAVLGGLALFALGLGMGAPLIAIGASAGKLLPKAGVWMESVKAVFGVMLIGLAIWLLERILPVGVIMALSGALLIGSAVYMGALRQVPEGKSGWHTLWKGFGFSMLIYGVIMIIGATSGGQHLLTPLKGVFGGGASSGQLATQGLVFKKIKGVAGLEEELKRAQENGQTVMLDFYADWCVSCKEMEAFVFTDAAVIAGLKGVVLLKADVTANDDDDKALMKSLGVYGPPAILFFGTDSIERKGYRIVGFTPATEFAPHTQKALAAQ